MKKKADPILTEWKLSEWFSAAFDHIPDLVSICDSDYRIVKVNKAFADAVKMLPDEAIGKTCYELLHKTDKPPLNCPHKQTLKKKETVRVEIFEPQSGSYFEVSTSPISNGKGEVIASIHIARDITERRKVEKALQESETRFRELINNMSSGAAVYEATADGEDFVFRDFNRAGENIDSIKKENVIGKKVTEVFPGVSEFGLLDVFQRVWKTGKPQHHPVALYKDNRIAGWRENYVYKLLSGEIVAVYDDITERKKLDKALKESEQKFRDLYDNAPDMYYSIDKDGTIIDCNRTFGKMLGYKREDVIGKHLTTFFTKRSKKLFEEIFPKITVDSALLNLGREFVRKDGRVLNVILNIYVERNRKGDFVGTRAIARDVTGLKGIKEELKSIARFPSESPYPVLRIDKDGYILYCNEAGKPMLDKWECKVGERAPRTWRKIIKDTLGADAKKHIQIKYSDTIILLTVVPFTGPGYVNLYGQDVTSIKIAEEELSAAYQELKDTQEQLIQSGKMAAMGQLAAGISHELNQPLTGIKGFAQAVLMDLDDDNPLRTDLNKIVEQADRMDKIIRHVRFFARKSDFFKEDIDISRPIEDALMLLNEQLRLHNIKVKKSLPRRLPGIRGDHNQLEQAFINIITNAKDAIDSLNDPGGGVIKIKGAVSKDKKHVELTFSDTGCGIAKAEATSIFNPFFTTKSPDGGMGLGLSIVYRIVENHGGSIDAQSQAGMGTTFKIMLPVNQPVQ
ncbi:sporulation kinase E [bacterium BMS3Bbin08]|nr:sporulation kinase E [bacterium BMS3Bbin08]